MKLLQFIFLNENLIRIVKEELSIPQQYFSSSNLRGLTDELCINIFLLIVQSKLYTVELFYDIMIVLIIAET